MSLTSSPEVLHIIQRALNHVDPRLIEHGERVAYLGLRLIEAAGDTTPEQRRDACIAMLLHDIGAYKTEEIDNMLQFETHSVWQHSIYGYLFLKHLSPLPQLAPAILFHHASYQILQALDAPHQDFAQQIHLADRVDTYLVIHRKRPPEGLFEHMHGRFSPGVLELLHRAERSDPHLYDRLLEGGAHAALETCTAAAPFDSQTIERYLRMVVCSIDFRSPHTVTHTITAESISEALARRMGLTETERYQVKYGALLHDLGKIAIPVEILESPGALSPAQMEIMKTHVTLTEEILGDSIDPVVRDIAVRHHEKLDGSGYPRGLTGDMLSTGQRIVAVADIVSALTGVRSYKKSFDKARVCSILTQMKDEGKLCPHTTGLMLAEFDAIMSEANQACAPTLAVYRSIQDEFKVLSERYGHLQ